MTYWYNGKFIDSHQITLEITNPGLIYGATLFTTLRIYQQNLDHRLTHWPAHIHRLETSLKAVEWSFSRWQSIREGAETLAKIYPVLRIAIFPDGKEWITGRFLPDNLLDKQPKGIKGWVAHNPLYHRSLAVHKTGNYLGAWLGLKKSQTLGLQESILVDSQGNWLETCTGNLWGWKDDTWYLPPEENILSGIMRSQLLKWLKKQSIPVQEIPWTPQLVNQLEIIAYSNSVVEVLPFQQILDQEQIILSNPHHPAFKTLTSYFGVNHS